MLTPKRFATLAASYGADLDRWPDGFRDEAEALLAQSSEAQALIADARALDGALAAAGVGQAEARWDETALVRLRLGVEAEIAGAYRPARDRSRPVPLWRLSWVGMATGSGLAIAAGLAIGVLYMPASSPDIVQMMFQPAPIGILAE